MVSLYRLLLLSLLTSFVLAGCNGQLPAAFFTNTPVAVQTQLPEAVTEDITSIATQTPVSAVDTAPVTFTTTPVTDPLAAGQGRPSGKPCDMVSAGLPMDVTIPDGTRVMPGQAFTKTWRLVNTGECTWTAEYAVVWFSGQLMGTDTTWSFAGEVQPGETVDITVDMVAPEFSGAYQSNWKLRNSQGQLFGLGPNGDAPFWVIVNVAESSTATAPAEATPAPTLAVFINGIVSLQSDDAVDLDSGDLNLDPGVDVRLVQTGAGEPQIRPENGAAIGMFGNYEPLEQDCEKAALGAQPLSMLNADSGVYLCYRTSQGLPGYAHVIRIPDEDDRLALDFITWTAP